MPVEGHLYADRVWFSDARGAVRRMGISVHPADSTFVVSLWQGDTCTGTFRMPAGDAARLISTLAYGMAELSPNQVPQSRPAPTSFYRWVVTQGRRLLGRPHAPTKAPLRLLK
jgi:hypothetical protein